MEENERFNILIVDDKMENIIAFKHVLEVLELNIYHALSGNEALGLMLEHDFALVLMDVQMPEINGFEVVELMKGSEKTRDIPIIFITAINNEREYVFKGYETGAIDYIFKPIKQTIVLVSKVRIFLDIYRQKALLKQQAFILEEKVKELEEVKQELEESNRKLEQLSFIDGLTDIYNRRGFDKLYHLKWQLCGSKRAPISAIMMDVDLFKNYNDQYGHLVGDHCLVRIAKIFAESVRNTMKFVARYGGKEFIMVLPETEKAEALEAAESLQDHIKHLGIYHEGSPVAEYVTVSMGIATIRPQKNMSPQMLLELADQALYQAKSNGRNTIVVSEEG